MGVGVGFPPTVTNHHCQPCQDLRTSEGYCPQCGVVMASPLTVSLPPLDGTWSGPTYYPGGQQRLSVRERGSIQDVGLRRAFRFDNVGRRGRDEEQRRWTQFRRNTATFELNRAMLADARFGLEQLYRLPTGITGFSTMSIDGALVFLVLRRHHKPVRTGWMARQLAELGCRRVAFHRAIRFVKHHTYLGAHGPSHEEFCWLADDRLPPRFVGRLREKARMAQESASLRRFSPAILVAGIAARLAEQEPVPGTTEPELCEIFSVTPDSIRRATQAITEVGLIG